MQRRISTRIGLAVGALLLGTLVVQVALMRLVTAHDVLELRDRASVTGLRMLALIASGGSLDDALLGREFSPGPAIGTYDAQGAPVARNERAPRSLPEAQRKDASHKGWTRWSAQRPHLYLARLQKPAGAVHYLALGDDYVDAHLRSTRLKVLSLITLAAALFGLGASVWLTRLIRRKLLVARATVRRVAEGELDVRFHEGTDDELGQLALDFNRMAERLGAHITQVRDEDARRRRIFADWTHEIATPLTSVLGYLEALSDGELQSERRARYVAQARDQARAMERLVEDLTVLSQFESEGVRLELGTTDLVALLDAELDASALRRAGVGHHRDLPPSLLCQVDAPRISQVVRNVLSNAERHARTRVAVRAVTSGAHVRIEIEDDGEGIAPEHLAHVTESFYRVDRSRDRQTGGRGLGLAIARQLLEAHGGSIALRSRVGEGTVVTLELPGAKVREARD